MRAITVIKLIPLQYWKQLAGLVHADGTPTLDMPNSSKVTQLDVTLLSSKAILHRINQVPLTILILDLPRQPH